MTSPNEAVARFEALLEPTGRHLLQRLAHEHVAPGTVLPLSTTLRKQYPAQLVLDALTQQELREQAHAKFSLAPVMFFTRAGLEQASSELVAQHRRDRYATGSLVADLCCGIGGDLIALAERGPVLAVDHDRLHVRIAEANAEAVGVGGRVRALCADVRDVDLAGVDGVFIDPARRTGDRRLRVGESEPPLAWCLRLVERVPQVGVKAAPGLPHDVVPADWELEFIAVGRDLKEAVAWSPAMATTNRRATVLPGGHTLLAQQGQPVEVRMPGEYLLDPNPAVTRAGVVEELARTFGGWKIDERIAFLSTDTVVHSPFARTLRVIHSGQWNQKRLVGTLLELDIGAVDIRRRGLAGDVDQIHRGLKLSGSRRATLVMTRVRDRPWALVCMDVDRPSDPPRPTG